MHYVISSSIIFRTFYSTEDFIVFCCMPAPRKIIRAICIAFPTLCMPHSIYTLLDVAMTRSLFHLIILALLQPSITVFVSFSLHVTEYCNFGATYLLVFLPLPTLFCSNFNRYVMVAWILALAADICSSHLLLMLLVLCLLQC